MDPISKREIWLCDPPRGLRAERLSLRHLPHVKEIGDKAFKKKWSDADYSYFLSSENGRCWGLFEDSKLVAYTLALLAQGDLDIVSIATAPTHLRQGLGQWMLEAAMKLPHVQRLFLEVDSSNEAAIKLYEKCQLVKYGTRKAYYEGRRDAWLMKRDT